MSLPFSYSSRGALCFSESFLGRGEKSHINKFIEITLEVIVRGITMQKYFRLS